MKASDNFAFDQKWWSKNKPVTLKSTGLGEVLKQYGALLTTARDFADAGSFKGIKSAKSPIDVARDFVTQKVRPAVKKAKDACNKTIHGDAITVLGKYDAAEKKELGVLDSMEKLFEKTYAKNADPVLNKAAALKKQCIDAGTQAEQAVTAMKKEAKAIEMLAEAAAKGTNLQAKQKALVEARKRLGNIDLAVKAVTKLLSDAEGWLKDMSKQKTDDLLPRDASAMSEFENDGRAGKNLITRCQNDLRSLHATAEGDVDDIDTQLDGRGTTVAEAQVSMQKVSTALKGSGEDSRRLDNNLTGAILVLLNIAKAKAQEAKGVEIHEAAKAFSIPIAPERWADVCKTWKTMPAEMTKKNNELLAHATDMQKKALARLTEEHKKDSKVAKSIGECNEYIKEITAYVGTISDHGKQLTSAITKLGY